MRELIAHALCASICYLIVAIPAMSLSLFVTWARQRGVAEFVCTVLEILECVTYVARQSFRVAKEIGK